MFQSGKQEIPQIPQSINTSSNKLLHELLESANNLPKKNDDIQLGSIHLTLNELQRKSQQLRKNQPNYTKAHYLLAGSGINGEDIIEDLDSIVLPEHKPHPSIVQKDEIENYLNNKKDENILHTIEQSLALASKDFDNYINSNISIDWKKTRDELKKSVGLQNGKTEKTPVIWKNENKTVQLPISSSARQMSREKFENHAKIIYSLNEARLQKINFPLCLNFNEVNKLQSDSRSKQISEIWRILIDLTDEKNSKINQEGKFINEKMDSLIIDSSKKYLQREFHNYIEEIFLRHNKPSTNFDKVSYFINQFISDDMKNKTLLINNVPIWAFIYYFLRCGLYQDALEFINTNQQQFTKFDKNFPVYFKKFYQGNLSGELVERLHSEFNQQFQFIMSDLNDSYDPFKYAVYKIIGKCDLSVKSLPSGLNQSIEDWLWFHLSLISESNSTNLIFENYTLPNLQQKILSLGEKRFPSSTYLKVLILSGLYDNAIKSLIEVNECDGVHLAVGLVYYGLTKFNLGEILQNYITSFKLSDPKVASQYLILIAMTDLAVCHESIRDLILISREFTILLGELNYGSNKPGILKIQRNLIKLENVSDFNYTIIEISANICQEEGRIFDALLLYQLSGDFKTVANLINKLISELLSTTDLNKSIEQDEIVKVSKNIIKTNNLNDKVLNSLLSIVNTRQSFINKDYNLVIDQIVKLDLIPCFPNDDLIRIRNYSQSIETLDINLVKVIPSLLILIMTSLSNLNYDILTKKVKSNEFELNRIKRIGKNCMIYAGMVQYKMPRETYSLLINLESSL